MKQSMKKMICAMLVLLSVAALVGCGAKKPDPVNTATCSYDDMVAYLKGMGYIAESASPVDMLNTAGYVTDNTGGQMPFVPFADRAEDYDGLWLMWWDSATPSEAYTSCFENIAVNGGTVVYMGGAAMLETAAYSGNFAIAFAEGYAKKDAVLTDFKALPKK